MIIGKFLNRFRIVIFDLWLILYFKFLNVRFFRLDRWLFDVVLKRILRVEEFVIWRESFWRWCWSVVFWSLKIMLYIFKFVIFFILRIFKVCGLIFLVGICILMFFYNWGELNIFCKCLFIWVMFIWLCWLRYWIMWWIIRVGKDVNGKWKFC